MMRIILTVGFLFLFHIANSLKFTGKVGKWTTSRNTPSVQQKITLSKLSDKGTFSLKSSNIDTSPENQGGFDLAAWFNPNTRGGVLVWGAILIVFPVALYNILVAGGMNTDTAGADVGFAFVCLSMVGWASTYLFRVANKDMTYARQLRDYENAVLQKRLEELADDEIQALLEEIEREDDTPATKSAI